MSPADNRATLIRIRSDFAMDQTGWPQRLGGCLAGEVQWEVLLAGHAWDEAALEVWWNEPETARSTRRIPLDGFARSLACEIVDIRQNPIGRQIVVGVAPKDAHFVILISEPPWPRAVRTKPFEGDERRIWYCEYLPKLRLQRLRAIDAEGDTIADEFFTPRG